MCNLWLVSGRGWGLIRSHTGATGHHHLVATLSGICGLFSCDHKRDLCNCARKQSPSSFSEDENNK